MSSLALPTSLALSLPEVGGWMGVIALTAGLIVAGLLLLLFRAMLRRRDTKRAGYFAEHVSSLRRPKELNDPGEIAKIAELSAKFQEGINTYRAAGKNIYSLPWYLLVGEAGSGKTELLRHSGVPTPLGDLPGVGGTINMNWWFTNHAVVLDTAGRIMFQQVEAGKTSEWKTFLELLNRARPGCPINGLLLVIPSDTLVRDPNHKVEEKARKIARQLELIQRTLDVRFPVFVIVAKADLINGFRPFFDGLAAQETQQILGWSNPSSDLDAPFEPQQIDRHLAEVRRRLLRRRAALLLDPNPVRDPSGLRADEVDDLYAFPDALLTIGPRLRLYLQTLFSPGEWSPKPLFLRGVYFTSSMRQGAPLDTELAHALGVPVETLPEGRMWDKERSFFLRDLFLRKVFPEKGLVTRQAKATGLYRRRRVGVMAAAVAAGLALIGLTVYAHHGMEQSVLAPQQWWERAASAYERQRAATSRLAAGRIPEGEQGSWMIVQTIPAGVGRDRKPVFLLTYGGDTRATAGAGTMTVADFHREALRQTNAVLPVPLAFRPVALATGGQSNDLTGRERHEAYRRVVEETLLRPLVTAARERMLTGDAPARDPAVEAAALQQLLRLEAAGVAPDSARPIELAPLLRYVLPPDQYTRLTPADTQAFQESVAWWLAARPAGASATLADTGDSVGAIRMGLDRFVAYWTDRLEPTALARRDSPVGRLRQSLADLRDRELALDTFLGLIPVVPKDVEAYTRHSMKVRTDVAELARLATGADEQLVNVKKRPGGWSGKTPLYELFLEELRGDIEQGGKSFALLQAELPNPPGALQGARDRLRKAREKLPLSSAPPVDESLSADFQTLQATYLGSPGEADAEPAFRRYVKAYQISVARLPTISSASVISTSTRPTTRATDGDRRPVAASHSTTAPSGPPALALDARLAVIQSELARATSDVESALSADAGRPHAALVRKAHERILSGLAGPAARHGAVLAALNELPASSDDVARQAAEAAKAKGRSDRRLSRLPMTALATVRPIDPRFDPAGAKEVLDGWRQMASRLEQAIPSAAAPASGVPVAPLIDGAGLRARLEAARRNALAAYVRTFTDYWLGIVRDATPGTPAHWAAFQAQLPESAESANSALRAIRAAAEEGLSLAVAESLAPEQARVMAALRTVRWPTTPEDLVPLEELQKRSDVVLRRWRALPAEPSAAAAAAIRGGPDAFRNDYLIPTAGNLSADYWAAVTKRGQDLLPRSSASSIPEAK